MGWKCSLMSMVKPPQPVSVTWNGGLSHVRRGFSYVLKILNWTLLSQVVREGSPSGWRT